MPRSEPSGTFEILSNTVGNDTVEGSGNRGGRKEYSSSCGQLITLVPQGEIKRARLEECFPNADTHTEADHSGIGFCSTDAEDGVRVSPHVDRPVLLLELHLHSVECAPEHERQSELDWRWNEPQA
jgi:hypothetical protein